MLNLGHKLLLLLFPLQFVDTLLLTRQVKSYAFLANSEVTVDNVDDAQQFKYTQVRVREHFLSAIKLSLPSLRHPNKKVSLFQ